MNKFFDNKYIDDINVNFQDNYFSPILDYCMKKYAPEYVCDIGCGNGNFSGFLKEKYNCKLIGIDGSKYALDKAKIFNYDQLILSGDFSSEKLQIKKNSVDFVICKDVLEHLINPRNLVKEIFKILKPGGILLSHVPNHFPLWGRLKFLLNNNIDTFNYFPGSNRYNFPHVRFFTYENMIKMYFEENIHILENLSFHFYKFPILDRFLTFRMKRVLCKISTDNFSEGITMLLRKNK